jgi:hypothetical protein
MINKLFLLIFSFIFVSGFVFAVTLSDCTTFEDANFGQTYTLDSNIEDWTGVCFDLSANADTNYLTIDCDGNYLVSGASSTRLFDAGTYRIDTIRFQNCNFDVNDSVESFYIKKDVNYVHIVDSNIDVSAGNFFRLDTLTDTQIDFNFYGTDINSSGTNVNLFYDINSDINALNINHFDATFSSLGNYMQIIGSSADINYIDLTWDSAWYFNHSSGILFDFNAISDPFINISFSDDNLFLSDIDSLFKFSSADINNLNVTDFNLMRNSLSTENIIFMDINNGDLNYLYFDFNNLDLNNNDELITIYDYNDTMINFNFNDSIINFFGSSRGFHLKSTIDIDTLNFNQININSHTSLGTIFFYTDVEDGFDFQGYIDTINFNTATTADFNNGSFIKITDSMNNPLTIDFTGSDFNMHGDSQFIYVNTSDVNDLTFSDINIDFTSTGSLITYGATDVDSDLILDFNDLYINTFYGYFFEITNMDSNYFNIDFNNSDLNFLSTNTFYINSSDINYLTMYDLNIIYYGGDGSLFTLNDANFNTFTLDTEGIASANSYTFNFTSGNDTTMIFDLNDSDFNQVSGNMFSFDATDINSFTVLDLNLLDIGYAESNLLYLSSATTDMNYFTFNFSEDLNIRTGNLITTNQLNDSMINVDFNNMNITVVDDAFKFGDSNIGDFNIYNLTLDTNKIFYFYNSSLRLDFNGLNFYDNNITFNYLVEQDDGGVIPASTINGLFYNNIFIVNDTDFNKVLLNGYSTFNDVNIDFNTTAASNNTQRSLLIDDDGTYIGGNLWLNSSGTNLVCSSAASTGICANDYNISVDDANVFTDYLPLGSYSTPAATTTTSSGGGGGGGGGGGAATITDDTEDENTDDTSVDDDEVDDEVESELTYNIAYQETVFAEDTFEIIIRDSEGNPVEGIDLNIIDSDGNIETITSDTNGVLNYVFSAPGLYYVKGALPNGEEINFSIEVQETEEIISEPDTFSYSWLIVIIAIILALGIIGLLFFKFKKA